MASTPKDEFDAANARKEAAMFFGLFLRGHPLEELRRDIDVPKETVEKWFRPNRYEPSFQETLRRVYEYRKQVLAVFDELVYRERHKTPTQ